MKKFYSKIDRLDMAEAKKAPAKQQPKTVVQILNERCQAADMALPKYVVTFADSRGVVVEVDFQGKTLAEVAKNKQTAKNTLAEYLLYAYFKQ